MYKQASVGSAGLGIGASLTYPHFKPALNKGFKALRERFTG
jgi:hypothetical protein